MVSICGCVGVQHYEDMEISFDYPSNWTAGKVMDLPVIVVISESSQVNVKIAKKRLPPNLTSEEYVASSIKNNSKSLEIYCYQEVSNRTLEVDGKLAWENIYQIGCNNTQTRQKIRNVWLEKNGYIYTITCTVIPPEDFEEKNKYFNIIIDSFKIK